MAKVHPIKPGEVTKEKERTLPDAVLETFNELIAQNWNGYSATVKQDEVVNALEKKGLNRQEIYSKGWLDVENIYRASGWSVDYDKPGYNETFPATFKFKRPSVSVNWWSD